MCSSEDTVIVYILDLYNYIKATSNPSDRVKLNQDCLAKGDTNEMNSNKENMAILASINLTSTSPYDS